jgi:hypothetical protein
LIGLVSQLVQAVRTARGSTRRSVTGSGENRPGGYRFPSSAVAVAVALALLLSACSGETERSVQGSRSTSTPTPPSPSPVPSATSAAPSVPSAVATATGSAAPPTGDPPVTSAQPTVPARPVDRLPPVPLVEGEGSDAAAEAGALRIDVVDVASVVSAGAGPGQVQGEPAVAFTVRWSNVGTRAVPLGTVVVDLSYGSGTPASPVNGPPSRPVADVVPPGGSVTGVYVFAVPADQRARVELTVSEGPALPTAVFSGRVP